MKWDEDGYLMLHGAMMAGSLHHYDEQSEMAAVGGGAGWYIYMLCGDGNTLGPFDTREAAMHAAEEAVLKWLREVMGEPVAWMSRNSRGEPAIWFDRINAEADDAQHMETPLFALPEVKP